MYSRYKYISIYIYILKHTNQSNVFISTGVCVSVCLSAWLWLRGVTIKIREESN